MADGQDRHRYQRAACFRAALSGIGCNPIVREHYQRKRAAGKNP